MSTPSLVERLIGLTPEEIEYALRNKRPSELIEIIVQLVRLEPHLTDKEFAKLRKIGARKVRGLMRNGEIAPAHKFGRTNAWSAPLSAYRRFDAKTVIPTVV